MSDRQRHGDDSAYGNDGPYGVRSEDLDDGGDEGDWDGEPEGHGHDRDGRDDGRGSWVGGWNGQSEAEEPPPPARGRRGLIAALAVVVLLGCGAWYLLGRSGGSGTAAAGGAGPAAATTQVVSKGFVPSSTNPLPPAEQTGQAFLDDWQNGYYTQAAELTSAPSEALAALKQYQAGLALTSVSVTITDSDGTGEVTYSVTATVGLPASAGGGAGAAASASESAAELEAQQAASSGQWSYQTELTAAQAAGGNGGWLVTWQPDVLAPNLAVGEHLATVAVPPGVGEVTDSAGNDLADSADPGLVKIAGLLAAHAPSGQGVPGIEVEVVDAKGTPAPGIAPATVSQPQATGTLATTISPSAEAAAMKAVGDYPQSSMVVIQPSTGDILAIANNDQQNDNALTARIAPGSTMKVVTSAALLLDGLGPDSRVACPETYTVTGVTFHNDDDESRPAATDFIDDFAASCNNAFTTQYQKLSGGGLANAAQTYFGLNEPWDIGLGQPQPYLTLPADAGDSELAAESFGQGTIGASPLAMASVAATVDTGSFRQPILVPGTAQRGATPLPSSVEADLREMMRAVITYPDGTAHDVGFGSGVYAKTGTADHGVAGAPANSWIIVFDPAKNIAIGCVVLNGNYGAQSAGPEAKSVLAAM